ncbi:hypothetical protein ACAH01_00735 [Halomicrobium sp. HM KBTZ05]|uniref:hypothetical protein n=1 Tax=Halomicrobium sp. HM KBTZ05 TaxID=3242663 RepID=UPI003557F046
MTKRRKFLKGIASTSLFGAVQGVTAESSSDNTVQPLGTGGAGNDEKLPVYADGRLVSHYRPDTSHEDRYILERKFESADLAERYGDPIFRYKDQILPKERVPEAVQERRKTTYTFQTKKIIGTEVENRNAEEHIRQQQSGEFELQDQADIDGNVPLYHYDPDADNEAQSRSSPLSLAWEAQDSENIKQNMENDDIGSAWQPHALTRLDEARVDKVVNLPNGGTKETDAHVMKWIADPICAIHTKQWHIRLYDVPTDGITAVGQPHRDPCDHGKLSDNENIDWKIAEARDQVADFWSDVSGISVESVSVGNTETSTEFESHDGEWTYFDDD